MSRMHNSNQGQSGSTRPNIDSNPDWVDKDEEKIEELIVELSQQGLTASEIGVKLRDQYGIPDVNLALGKGVAEVMEEKDLQSDIPEDLMALIQKAVNLHQHLEENPKDRSNKRGLQLVEAKIRRLAQYYKDQGRLPEDWKYSLDKAEILTQ